MTITSVAMITAVEDFKLSDTANPTASLFAGRLSILRHLYTATFTS